MIRRAAAAATLAAALIPAPERAGADSGAERSFIVFAGQMTDNHWEDALKPWKIDLLESWFVGVGLGYEWPTRVPRLGVGLEAQLVGHFGRQDHLEFNLPLVLRYRPARPAIPAFQSAAFGLGLSTTTQDPQTEIDRDGETSKTLVYWMGEAEFLLPRSGASLVLRLHHRSDAFGVFATDSGSNALAIGIRRRF